MLCGAIGYIGKVRSHQKGIGKQNEGKALGGSSKDVACIDLTLDIGDIAGGIDSEARKDVFIKVFGSVTFEDNEIERYFNSQREDFENCLLPQETENLYGSGKVTHHFRLVLCFSL